MQTDEITHVPAPLPARACLSACLSVCGSLHAGPVSSSLVEMAQWSEGLSSVGMGPACSSPGRDASITAHCGEMKM